MSSTELFWIKVNGILLPTPITCPITEYDMHSADTNRDESAVMHITQVRGNLRDCELAWEGLTPAQAILIRNATAPLMFTVSVHFLGSTVHFQAYKGDRKWVPNFSGNGSVEKWNLTLQLIAV